MQVASGFYGKEIFDYLEKKELVGSYIIGARQYKPIQQNLAGYTLQIC
jgi:hypothetical protein